MNRLGMILPALVAFVSVPVLADVQVGDEAPKISAVDWYNLPRGIRSLKQSHLDGQIVLVEFWATW